MQQHLENPLAQQILAGTYAPGDTIVVNTKNGELVFGRKRRRRSRRRAGKSPNAPGGRA